MTTEEKFNAAVNVIRSLPKNGSYQPSSDLMLRFYAYYKQATLGPCTARRPPFYDVVGRAKHDAWAGLGDMSRQRAMAKYVDELHTIVETMSYSDKVANFLEAPSEDVECVNMIMDDLELIAGDVLERVRSQPNSPLASREASPIRMMVGSREASPPVSTPSSTAPDESDHSDDEYIDTIEFPETKRGETANGYIPREHVSRARSKTQPQHGVDVSQEVAKAVQSLKLDVERLNTKLHTIEKSNVRKYRFSGMSLEVIAFIVLWPFLATFVMNRYFYNRK